MLTKPKPKQKQELFLFAKFEHNPNLGKLNKC